jgi:hypothetical protein
MVEMNETELSDVSGQALSVDGFYFKVFGYEVTKNLDGEFQTIDNTTIWNIQSSTKVISPAIPTPAPDDEDALEHRTFYKKRSEIRKGVDGVRYIKPTFKWGPYIPNTPNT